MAVGYSVLRFAVNREVVVEVDELKVCGRLVAVCESHGGKNHRPCVLILETCSGQCLVRGWDKIVFEGRF